jgi:hypothetical protein
MLVSAEFAEAAHHSHGDGESCNELVVLSSTRRQIKNRRHSNPIKSHKAGARLLQTVTHASRIPAIISHELANGLRAPLLI